MTEKQKQAFEVLEVEMQRIADNYLFYVTHSQKETISEAIIYFTNRVERSFLSLNEFEKSLLNKEFFYQDYQGWWKSCLKEETFLFLKRKTIYKFLEAFYNE